MMDMDGCIIFFWRMWGVWETRTVGLWCDHLVLWVHSHVQHLRFTALRVISSATAIVFKLEIYSSAFLILIGGGCLPFFSFSSRVRHHRKQPGKPLQCEPFLINPLYFLFSLATKFHAQRTKYCHSSASTRPVLAVDCSPMLHCTVSAESLGAISCHLREHHGDSLSAIRSVICKLYSI